MRKRGSAGEAEPQLNLFGAAQPPAPTTPPASEVRVLAEATDETPPPPEVACFAPAPPLPASDPPPALPLPSILPAKNDPADEEPAVIADRIVRGLKEAILLVEEMMLDLGGSPGEASPAPEAPFVDRLMFELGRSNKRAEIDCARLDAMLEELSPGAREAARAANAPRPKATRPARGYRGAEVRDDDGITHRELTERQRELVRGLIVDEAERVYGPRDHIGDWPALKIVVQTLGGQWHNGGGSGAKKRQGHWTFAEDVDPRELLRVAVDTGRLLDTHSNDLYETPEPLADELVALADIQPGMHVLEPSGGRGRLALAVRRACPSALVVCVELLEDNAAELERLGFKVIRGDFLKLRPGDLGVPYDRAIMNPPFSKLADARHIGHALGFLRNGGKLAAIASGGLRWRTTGIVADLRRTLEAYGATWKDLGRGAFSEAGTEIRTCIVTATKT